MTTSRPYVICHMMCSVDGRVRSGRWGIGDTARFFEKQAAKIKVDAWVVGRRTMEEFSSQGPRPKATGSARIPKQDFIAETKAKTFAVAIDPSGKCNWESNQVDTDHVIEVLTEKVSSGYLAHLRASGVSYIFGGRRELDLERVLIKLKKHFGIQRVRLDGGGGSNGSFLKAGLVDELSLVLMPVADGTMNSPTVFDVEGEPHPASRMATRLQLRSVRKIEDGALWLRYQVRESRR